LNGADEPNFDFRADLRESALPEMLFTIDRFQVPGVIEVEREGVLKRVFIREGNVVHATSTDRADSLGAFLERTGKLSPDQTKATMAARAGTPERRYGEVLIEAGLISPAEIQRAILKQIEGIVWSLFYWTEGELRFKIGGFSEPSSIRIQLAMRQVIHEGIKRAPNAKALVPRLGRKETVFESSYKLDDLIEVGLDENEYALLKLVDGHRTLYDICTQGPFPAADNAKVMYAFYVLRLVRRQTPEAGATGSFPVPTAENLERGERKVIKIRFKTTGDRFNP
jgi:hypothetical protein